MVGDGIVYPPNMPSLSGIADVRVYDPMRPWAHYLLTRPVNNPAAPQAIHHSTHPESPLFDLLGARFLVAGAGSPPPFGKPPVLRTQNCWIYRRPHALPILFLPAAAEVYRSGDWAEQVAAIDDFAARALVQGVTGHQDDWRAGSPEAARLDLADPTGPGRDLVRATALLIEPRLLATSLYQDGGWNLLVDREHHPTLLANGVLVAAWLPPGDLRLDLVYRPPGFLAGMLLAALGLAAAAGWWLRPAPSIRRN